MSHSNEYAESLKQTHQDRNWGITGPKYAGQNVIKCIEDRPYIRTVLDYGCGKGLMKSFLQKHFPKLEISEYDPGISGKDRFPKTQFDLVITTDVLEHVEPEHINATILQLESLTKFVMFNDIACSPTGVFFPDGPYKGQDLHLIIEQPIWWKEKFAEVCTLTLSEFHHSERLSNKGYKPRCLLIHERSARS